jgi:hypothetical protein
MYYFRIDFIEILSSSIIGEQFLWHMLNGVHV